MALPILDLTPPAEASAPPTVHRARHHRRALTPFAKNTSPLPAPGSVDFPDAKENPGLTLSIHPTFNAGSELIVSGTSGGLYGIAVTSDFKTWTNGSIQIAASNGQVTIPATLSASRVFYRAFAAIPATPEADPPEVAIGERLFLETRFAQFFAAHSNGDVNLPLAQGDPALDKTVTLHVPASGPFRGQSMNCRACHLVDEQKEGGLGNRTYADFARRSPVPDRADGRSTTPRNSPPIVNASIDRPGAFFLHADAEFVDGKSLIKATYTGRNFGWLAGERVQAMAQIAKVIREDNGQNFLGPDFGGAYRTVLAGTDPAIPGDFRLPERFRLEVEAATDDQIFDAVATLVNAYMESLAFVTNENGEYDATPYDLFLKNNLLPRKPEANQDDKSYGRRLLGLIQNLAHPVFVTSKDGSFTTQTQEFKFGAQELQGLEVFLSEPPLSPVQSGVGNCIACHAPPHFTDFSFHNTGAAQYEYDSVHGADSFARIAIPGLAERSAAANDFLPVTAGHPNATERFRTVPSLQGPGIVDLGIWNIYANSDFPSSQEPLQMLLSLKYATNSVDDLLPKTVAVFKTSGLRDLGQSAPYLHTGQFDSIGNVLDFYSTSSNLARTRKLRNSDAEVARIFLDQSDINALAAFLNSLNEDYE